MTEYQAFILSFMVGSTDFALRRKLGRIADKMHTKGYSMLHIKRELLRQGWK